MTDGEGTFNSQENSKPKVRVIAPIEGLQTSAQMAPSRVSASISRTCAYHQSIPAVYICAKCTKAMCMSCARPHGHLYLCPQCYQPPPPVTTQLKKVKAEPPPFESILGLFGGLLIIVGFFLPWVKSEYQSPDMIRRTESIISGFDIASDYSEIAMVLIFGILIVVLEFLLIMMVISLTVVKKPAIGVRLLPMVLGFIIFVILIEIVIRAESFAANIHVGWFTCLFGTCIIMLRSGMEIWKHYYND